MGADGREGAAWIKAQRGPSPDRGRRDLRRLRDAAVGRRGGLSDASVPLERHGRRDTGAGMSSKILVVDDSGLARRGTRRILEAAGYEVVEAEDGMAALERYFLEKPDVVLLDLVMKGMYGLDVLTKLRELDAAARVIVVSADIQTSSHELVSGRRRRGFLNKPVDGRGPAARGAHGARRSRRDGAHRRPAGRAGRAAEHRLRPRRRVAVAADRPARAARGAAGHRASDRGRSTRRRRSWSSRTTWRACTRSSPARSPATRC